MDWADELAARVSGPQVVNDSKTPSGTVHVGSLRGPVILDVIARALRANGLETTLLYGVDDMDPMDAQALLTPDAIETEMGRPLAHVPDQAGDGHASYARHHAQAFIDVFAGLGIHPDRYYWMSDIYPTGAMDPYIRLALDRAALVREIYRRVANVQHPETWHPVGVVCPTCGKVGTTIVTDWDGERVFYECRPDLVTWATRLRLVGLDQPVRRARRSCPGTSSGQPSGRSSGSPSSRAARTFRRPAARATAATRSRGRSSSANRRSTCPTSSSTSAARRCRPRRGAALLPIRSPKSSRPSSSASCSCDPARTRRSSSIRKAPMPIPRLFDEFDRFAAATAGREVKGETPPGFEATFRYSLLDPDADVAAEAAAFRPAFAHLALLVQIPGVDVARPRRGGEGECPDRARAGDPR